MVAACFQCRILQPADVTDLDPINQLSEDEAITSVQKAQSALLGTYSVLKSGLELPVYWFWPVPA